MTLTLDFLLIWLVYYYLAARLTNHVACREPLQLLKRLHLNHIYQNVK